MDSNSPMKSALAGFRAASALFCFALVSAFPAGLNGQTAVFAGAQTTLASSLTNPKGIAVDAKGNVYIAVPSANSVVELHADGSPQTMIGAGLLTPSAVTVDAAGDVLIADSGHNRILVVPSCACAQYDVPITTLSNPTGVAVDANNDVFIADSGNNRVVEVNLAGGTVTAINATVQNPEGIASDGANRVYIANYYNGQILQVTLQSGGGLSTVVFSSAFEGPKGLAVDSQGNVYVADALSYKVSEIPAGGGTPTVVGGFGNPYGVAVDNAGDIFVADTGNDRAVEVQTRSVNFGEINLCPAGGSAPSPCSQTITLNYNVTSPADLKVGGVYTSGAPNLDFTPGAGSTCGSITTGTTCTANVTFTPVSTGLRLGAIQITNDSGSVLATTYLRGIGAGPQMAYSSGTQTTVGTGIAYPVGIAMDGAGDVFIADDTNEEVIKVPVGGGTQTTVGSGLKYPTAIAVDGAGDIFIADPSNQRIVEVPAGGGAQTTVGTGFEGPDGVAVDGAGNVFVADDALNNVVEVPAGGGAQRTIASGLNDPARLAVDGTGNVFIVDGGNKRVVEAPAGGGTPIAVGAGLSQPVGVSVDAAGDVFIADSGNDTVVEVTAGGGTQTTVGTGFFVPEGVFVGSTGDVYIADIAGHQVLKLPRSQAPSVSFAATPFATLSNDSPVNVGVENIGNRPLEISDVNYPVDFPADFDEDGTENLCFGSDDLEAGQVCYLAINFEPFHAGTLNEDLTLTDNALNRTGAVQSVALSGTSTAAAPEVSFSSTSLSYGIENVGGSSASQTVTMSNSGSAALSITSILVGGANASSFVFSNNCGSSLAAGANCAIQGHFAPTAPGGLTALVTIVDNAGTSPQTISLSGMGATPATLTFPTPGSTLGSPNVTFTWTTGTGVTQYDLHVGTTGAGSSNIFGGTVTGQSKSVSGIPTTGGTLSVRLYSLINGAWQYIDYTFTESSPAAPATMTSPTPSSTLTGSSAAFSWTTGTQVTQYDLHVGTSGVASSNIFAGTVTGQSKTVTGIPTSGGTLYVRLYSLISGVWQSIDYTYTEASPAAPATMMSPTPGTALTGSSATFTWTAGSQVTQYDLHVGTTGAGSSNLFGGTVTGQSKTVTGIPTTGGTLNVRLYSLISGAWQYVDYTFTEQ